MLQETYLFDDTIAHNIAFGESDRPRPRPVGSEDGCEPHDFVERLPLGYETRIGESGLRLSGGQRTEDRHRACHLPPAAVLVLDEAASALDSESERSVQRHLDELMAGRTTIVIAHRLSTVREADLIVVLDRGRIVERGAHGELMERQGLYYYLVGQQLQQ